MRKGDKGEKEEEGGKGGGRKNGEDNNRIIFLIQVRSRKIYKINIICYFLTRTLCLAHILEQTVLIIYTLSNNGHNVYIHYWGLEPIY
jgi:hypothetical protein